MLPSIRESVAGSIVFTPNILFTVSFLKVAFVESPCTVVVVRCHMPENIELMRKKKRRRRTVFFYFHAQQIFCPHHPQQQKTFISLAPRR